MNLLPRKTHWNAGMRVSDVPTVKALPHIFSGCPASIVHQGAVFSFLTCSVLGKMLNSIDEDKAGCLIRSCFVESSLFFFGVYRERIM